MITGAFNCTPPPLPTAPWSVALDMELLSMTNSSIAVTFTSPALPNPAVEEEIWEFCVIAMESALKSTIPALPFPPGAMAVVTVLEFKDRLSVALRSTSPALPIPALLEEIVAKLETLIVGALKVTLPAFPSPIGSTAEIA